MDHSELVRLAEPLMSAAPSQGALAEPPSEYVGGDWRLFSASPITHGILAFEYAGGWRDVKGSVAMTVLQYLLGGGGSFSSGALFRFWSFGAAVGRHGLARDARVCCAAPCRRLGVLVACSYAV